MKILVAVPSYDGKVHCRCTQSLICNVQSLKKEGHDVLTCFHMSDCYITRARNFIVHTFLQTDCTDLIFVDSDLSFDDGAFCKLMNHDKDIIAGAYPFKGEAGYPVHLLFDSNNNCKDESTGLVNAEIAPTGLMRIKRNVFDSLNSFYKFKPDNNGMIHYFAEGVVMPEDNCWYGEDVVFCKRVIKAGLKIWIETDINFTHYGSKGYRGNYKEYLTKGV